MQTNSKQHSFKEEIIKIVANSLENLLKQYEAKRTTILEFLETYSDLLDALVLQTETQENLEYQAGNVILQALPNNAMQFHLDLYYQNKQGAWVNKKQSSHIMEMEIYLNDEAIAELNRQQEMKYPFAKPEKK